MALRDSQHNTTAHILGTAAEVRKGRQGEPLYPYPLEAGFPSPVEETPPDTTIQNALDTRLDLHAYVVHHENATFFLRARGFSMIQDGVYDGDLLVVDRALEAAHNRIVIAVLEGEMIVKRLERRRGRVLLTSESPVHWEYDITGYEYVHIWGVVTFVVHQL